ncbi:hypothetical protein Dda_8392 [Drechslerella dactyloides]|uniref:Uncharacterized protein n=1 Tax=Drechslerella dactyloides TaxID=74499 RepID=A0AAD6IS22_DREDA|nr:hypothetical protein Dda_8392 [Drechslerella dactyloides]
MKSTVVHPLVLSVLVTCSSAFYLEILRDDGKPGEWQLCRATSANTKAEVTVFGIDPVETSCEDQGGASEWSWSRPPALDNVYDDLARTLPDNPRMFYLDTDGPLQGQSINSPQSPIIYLGGLFNRQLQLGTSDSNKKIPVSWRLYRGGKVVEVTEANPPRSNDIVRFYGHKIYTPDDYSRLLIADLWPRNQYPDGPLTFPLYREDSMDESSATTPRVYLRVQSKANFDDNIALERGLRRERDAIDSLNPSRIISNLWNKAKNKVSSAKEKVTNKLMTGMESGIARITGSNNNPRLHIHPEEDPVEEEKWEEEPDPAEQGGMYYGQGGLGNVIQNYVPQQQAQIQPGPRIEQFDIETIKKGGN